MRKISLSIEMGTPIEPVDKPSVVSVFDPTNNDDADAICAVLDGPDAVLDQNRALVTRSLDDGALPRVRAHAQVVEAYHAFVDGDLARATRLNRGGLRELWGSGTMAERIACINLATTSSSQHRALEALLFSRRAWRLSCASGIRGAMRASLFAEFTACSGLESWARFDEILPQLEVLVHDANDWPVSHVFHLARARAAIRRGRFDGARMHLERARKPADAQNSSDDEGYTLLAVVDSLLCFFENNFEHASTIARVALDTAPRSDSLSARLRMVDTLATVRMDPSRGTEMITELLEALQNELRPIVPSGIRCDIAMRLATMAEGHLQDRELASLAYDVGGASLIERMSEIERFRQEFPELHPPDEVTTKILEAYSDRLVHEHAEILSKVCLLFSGDPASINLFLEKKNGAALVLRVCAWCTRVLGPEGAWIDLPQLPPQNSSEAIEVSHAICESCVKQF